MAGRRPGKLPAKVTVFEIESAHALIDTGAIVAILDRTDIWHGACVEAYNSLPVPLLTSEAVLTETFHLAADDSRGGSAVWDFIMSGAIHVCAISQDELPAIRELMGKYADRPMDFADATLVYLARRESLSTVLTVDHGDFSTYRIEGKRGFRILPASRP